MVFTISATSLLFSLIQPVLAADPTLTINRLDSQRQLNQSEDGYGDVKDGYMFVADDESGSLKVINTVDANNPVTKIAESDYIYRPDRVRVVGDYVVLTGSDDSDYYSPKQLVVFSIANPENVHEVARLPFADGASIGADTCIAIEGMYAIAGNLLIDAACDSYATRMLITVDMTDPTNPLFGDSVDYTSQSADSGYGGQFESGTFYLMNQTVLAFDINDITNISFSYKVNTAALGLNSYRMQFVKGGNLYGFAKPGASTSNPVQLYTFDISNPATPSILANITSPDFNNNGCNYGDKYTKSLGVNNFLTQCGRRLYNFNTSTPTAPYLVGSAVVLSSSNLVGVDSSRRVYLNDSWNYITVEVHDASNLAEAPLFVGAKNIDITMRDMTSNVLIPNGSNTAIVVGGDDPILRTIDITDPNNLSVIGDHYLTQNGRLIDDFGVYHSYDTSLSNDGQFMYVLDHGNATGGYLTVLDISDLSDIQIASRTALPAEKIQTGVIVNNTWHVLGENNFYTYSINPSTGAVTALDSTSYTKPAGAAPATSQRGLAVVNGAAIMLFGVQSARVVDVSDPSNIGTVTASSLPAMGNYLLISRPHVIGNNLYLLSSGVLYAIDASNASAMTLLSSVNGGFDSSYYSAAIDEIDASTLLIAEESGGTIGTVDISNPSNISIIGTAPASDDNGLFPPGADGFGGFYSYTVKDDVVYGISSGSDSNFYSVDISDITDPKPLDVITNQIAFWKENSNKFINTRLYIAGSDMDESESDLSMYSLTNPDQPAFTGTSLHAYDSFFSMAEQGNYLYTTRDYGGLVVYDISDPDFAIPLTMVSELSKAYDIAVQGDYLYIADEDNGLMIYDITDPETPVQVSTFTDGNFDSLDSLEVRGNRVYGVDADANQAVIIDVSNPSTPATVSTITNASIQSISQLTIHHNQLYISSKGNGGSTPGAISLYSLTNPDSPSLVGQYSSPDSGIAYGKMNFYDGFVLVTAEQANRIDVINFTDNTNPVFYQSIGGDSSLQGVNDMEVVGNRLYTISRLGQSLNTYSLEYSSSTPGTPGAPGTPTAPSVENDPILAPNTGYAPSERADWALHGAGILILLGATALLRKLYSR
jgi:hypothetical protein